MQKTFVLSTKSLLSSENSTQRFGADNEIVIPMAILENLQHFQGTIEEKKMAQTILEYVEHFPIDDLYHKGAKQENESILRICDDCPDEVIEINVSPLYKRCFQVCKNLSKTRKNVIFITKDPVIRMKAREIGIQAQNFKDDLFPKLSEQYTGRVVAKALESDIDRLMQEKEAPKEIIWEHEKIDWYPNLFLNVTTESASGSVIVRYDQNKKKLVPLRFSQRDYPDHLKTKNVGQLMAMECLLSYPQDAPLVIIKGGAGTGKTFCSLAVALEHLKGFGRESRYRQILVATPQITVGGEDIGALPGNIDKKVGPKLGGIYDNLKVILNPEEETEEEKREKYSRKQDTERKEKFLETGEELFKRRLIEIQPIGFLRGRTITNTFFIIDETQNIEPNVIKTIITRAAKGSKFVFLGDPSQVDNPKLNERYNGLVYVSEKFKKSPLTWQVTLKEEESVRSPLAQYASQIL